jgi:hypothetical protein
VLGVPLGQPPGVGSVTRKGGIANQALPVLWFRQFLHDGSKNVVIPNRYEQRSLASDRDRNKNEPKLALFGVPFRHPPGVSWPPIMNVGGGIDNRLVGTRLSDDFTRDG